ncbi:DM9 repeat-containing protein [Legionella cardiaca]|uniref:DUF3421 domain-containing protein n=1 Tax=Legionella cardiaca TaxID=1071983 RepID=A0ABY8AXF4_9GAMM|nr:DM9 repeat-containing protein [Legionella cardiaca]WED44424.1 DUF3421 domain-containing protein [Legionella cardiaca]
MTETKKGMLIFLVLGLLLGSVTDILHYFNNTNSFFYSTILLFCLFYGLSYNEKNNFRLILTSLGLAILLASPFIPLHLSLKPTLSELANNLEQIISFLILFPLVAYVGHSFHYAYHHDNSWRMRYPTLFSAVWDSFILLIAASIFSGIAKLLLILAAGMFKTVGNDLLWNLYYNNFNVYVLINTVLFFIGLGIAHQHKKTIHSLRFLLLRMMHFLLPLLAVISIIYFLLYLNAIAQPVQNTLIAPEYLLASLVIIGIIFFNAHFQTGNEQIHPSLWLSLLLKVYRVVLFCLCAILSYRLIQFYSLPINFGLCLLVALLYCASYANAAFMPADIQRRWITSGNKIIALFFLLAMLLLNNPFYPIHTKIGFAKTTHQQTLFQSGPIIPPVAPAMASAGLTIDQVITDIDKQLAKLNLFWTKEQGQKNFVAGYRNDKTLYICRAQYNNGYQIGLFFDNQCVITYAGQSFSSDNYQILATHDKTPAFWTAYPSKFPMLGLGAEPTQEGIRILYACQIKLNERFYVGKVVAGFCNVALNNREFVSPIQTVLASPSNTQ